MNTRRDATVVGSGPNGLAAALELARNGIDVTVIEGHPQIGGGTRTAELTLPGFHHDVCSAAHPFGPSSPFLQQLPLAEHGLEWVTPPVALAHPLDDGTAVLLESDISATAAGLGSDARTYRHLLSPLVEGFTDLADGILAPLVRFPRHPLLMARFGSTATLTASRFAQRFDTGRARALIAGLCAHGTLPFDRPGTAGTGLALAVAAHHNGWPVVRGGSHRLTGAMASYLTSLGGVIETGRWVERLGDLPPTGATLLDVTPDQLLAMGGSAVPHLRRRRLRRWKYGPATFKVDFAVDRPVPWTAPGVARSGTVHLGGTYEEIAAAEAAVWQGRLLPDSFVLVTQPSRFDDQRAPEGGHTVWAYCHVPQGYTGDATAIIENQIERFAPGFGDTILGRHVMGPRDFERYNPNNVHGSIGGGAMTFGQIFARPRLTPWPHATGIDDVYLCSSATAPGAGAHGMCGYHAARTALAKSFR